MAEKRLIDANLVIDRLKTNIILGATEQAFLINYVNCCPTVDAVEVVRCRDCKWYRIAPIDNVPYCCHESGYCGEYMGGLFYCACGERRTDG